MYTLIFHQNNIRLCFYAEKKLDIHLKCDIWHSHILCLYVSRIIQTNCEWMEAEGHSARWTATCSDFTIWYLTAQFICKYNATGRHTVFAFSTEGFHTKLHFTIQEKMWPSVNINLKFIKEYISRTINYAYIHDKLMNIYIYCIFFFI